MSSSRHLPLPRHQAHGTYMVRVKRTREGFNPVRGVTEPTLRSAVETVERPVLELECEGTLLPRDEEMPSA